MAAKAPLSLSVNNSANAPKTINIIFKAITTPLRLDAKTQFRGVSQTKSTNAKAIKKESGMALVADQRKPTIRIKIIAMGITDNRASVPTDILIALDKFVQFTVLNSEIL
jgi:hypothetical protein